MGEYRKYCSELNEMAYRGRWLGSLELWLRLGIEQSGTCLLEDVLAVDMDVEDRTIKKYLEVGLGIGLFGFDGEYYWVRGTETVEKELNAKGPRCKWWPNMPIREFTYAIAVMVLLNFFLHVPALRNAGAEQELGGVSHSQMARKLGITPAASSMFRRRCEALGFMSFERRSVLMDEATLFDLDIARSLFDDEIVDGLFVDDGEVKKEVASLVHPQKILLSIRSYA